MNTYALAIDIGASGGRHMAGHLENGKMAVEEIYRFPNGMQAIDGRLCWDTKTLLFHILEGLKRCKEKGVLPKTVGIDTWGVDFALLDDKGNLAAPTFAYRDGRTKGMPEKLSAVLSPRELYEHTGVAAQEYNTVYQLMAQEKSDARALLFMPCYLSYLLTGVMKNEYTIASTSGLLNARTRAWDQAAIQSAQLDARLLGETPAPAGTLLGAIKKEFAEEIGFSLDVVLPACHDTASAYLAVPTKNAHAAILSSGTWSLLGMALKEPVLSKQAQAAGFTNEGGYNGHVRFLRNIMGMWLLQALRKEWNDRYSYAQMAEMALHGADYPFTFDPASERFLSPKSMEKEIRQALQASGADEPKTEAQLLYAVHHSLARCYKNAVQSLAQLTNQTITCLHIVGGGCQNRTLNQLTANETGLPVLAGPTEGTAIGNLMAQWIYSGALKNEEEAQEALRQSAEVETFFPQC